MQVMQRMQSQIDRVVQTVENLKSSTGDAIPRRSVQCFHCQQEGHIVRMCPLLKASKQRN